MNHLAQETSPYLRQHRENPVEWYPWGPEAFERARSLDRPLFISIGYSACHWCHVMAHESFEDEATARYVNEHFVAVKVDREERPDVDAIYMDAVVAMTGQGGWPLTIFATPEGRPFFGGTYFPKVPRGNFPSFVGLCEGVSTAWREQRDRIDAQADELTSTLATRLGPPPGAEQAPDATALLAGALDHLDSVYDPQYGGIGDAPKFPQAPILELALRGALRGRRSALEIVTSSLLAMASGGIYDHLGGGFSRYSVDRHWLVPHFEKMLYDQAGLARLALHAWQITGDDRFAQILRETIDYVLRDLGLPGGGLASAEDADSDGGEGRFYTWTPGEIAAVLGPDKADAAIAYYGVSERGNFEEGRSILHRPVVGELARPKAIEEARARLFAARALRVRPGLDDKVLTEWNAMMLSVLAEAASATGSEPWRDAALELAEFLCRELRRPDGRWLRSWQAGRAQHLAVAGDYAWLVEAFTRVAELTGTTRWLHEAQLAAEGLVELFRAEDGGFCLTGADAPELVVRPRETYDGVLPAAGSVAAQALGRLGALVGDEALIEVARGAVAAAGEPLERAPMAFPALIGAALTLADGAIEIVVAGERPDLLQVAHGAFRPEAVLLWGERDDNPLWEGRVDGHAYVCHNGTCLAPVSSPDELETELEHAMGPR